MSYKHWYIVKMEYERYDGKGKYKSVSMKLGLQANSEEQAIKQLEQELRYRYSDLDFEAPNGEYVKGFKGTIVEKTG